MRLIFCEALRHFKPVFAVMLHLQQYVVADCVQLDAAGERRAVNNMVILKGKESAECCL